MKHKEKIQTTQLLQFGLVSWIAGVIVSYAEDYSVPKEDCKNGCGFHLELYQDSNSYLSQYSSGIYYNIYYQWRF